MELRSLLQERFEAAWKAGLAIDFDRQSRHAPAMSGRTGGLFSGLRWLKTGHIRLHDYLAPVSATGQGTNLA
jgi:hypothetical protein